MSDVARLFSLAGRVAIVTGASRGIGAAMASGLAGAGAQVTGVGRSDAPEESGGEYDYRSCDITDASAGTSLLNEVHARHGRFDILVNAAGVTLPSGEGIEGELARFDRTIDVDLRAVYALCLTAAGLMKANGGSIINVTSIASITALPDNPPYVAAKGGLRMLSRALALDFGECGIRVNNIVPGYVRTEMTEKSYQDPQKREKYARHTMLGRWGSSDDLVGAAVFLASDAAGYVTGQDIVVDGGWTSKGMV